jgi:DNA-binding NarL/FixJ family response regulator
MDTDIKRVSIVIADDHAIFRDGLRKLLEAEGSFELIGEASNGVEAIELVRRLAPDVLLLDLNMPRLGGLDALSEVVRSAPAVRTIILAASVDRREIIKALRLGARGIVLKTAATDLLYKCIEAVIAGEVWVGRESVPEFLDALEDVESKAKSRNVSIANLTERETDRRRHRRWRIQPRRCIRFIRKRTNDQESPVADLKSVGLIDRTRRLAAVRSNRNVGNYRLVGWFVTDPCAR